MNTPPRNDAALLAGGANVNGPSDSHNFNQLPLYLLARHNASVRTPSVTAKRMSGYATKQRADVLAVIEKAGAFGATDADTETATGIRAQTVSPRRGELRTLGLVVDSGRRCPTPRGRPAAVWVLSEFAPKPEGVKPRATP